jgi:hypothetical protein
VCGADTLSAAFDFDFDFTGSKFQVKGVDQSQRRRTRVSAPHGLEFLFGALAHGYKEYRAFAFGVRREELGYIVVEKREAGGAEVLGVSRQIQLAAEDAGLELHGAVSPIAEALQDRAKVSQEEHICRGIGGQGLLQSQVAGLGAEISLL